ncbi:putative quinol monooxygenase [Chitinophagaceae bacterium MMS25-I14]
MIVRIVQMAFRNNEVNNFLELFEQRKQQIRNFNGCRHLELWQDAHNKNIFFTYSKWESEAALDHYRFSDFFKDTWSRTKALFEDKPQAWSVIQRVEVEGTN